MYIAHKEIEKENTNDNSKDDPYGVGQYWVRNSVNVSFIISSPEDGEVRTANGK